MYRTIDASFWTDPKVKKLDASGRLLLLYLITNPHSHVSGIYIVPWLYVQHETGLSSRALDTVSDTLSSLGIVRFDRSADVVFVVNMLGYQGRGEKNLRSAANQVRSLHKSYLLKEFLDKYPAVRQYVPNTLLDTLSESGTPDQEQDQEQDQNASQSSPVGDREPKYPEDFERFWQGSTKRGSKLDAFKAWKKINPDEGRAKQIGASHSAWMRSDQWQDETKQPHISTWLNRRGWDEIIPRSKIHIPNGNGGSSTKYTPEQIAEATAKLRAGGVKIP